MRRARVVPSLLTLALALYGTQAVGQAPNDAFAFDDTPLSDLLVYPPWFKKSFLDLQDDLAEAGEAGKKGIIVYFGQKRCAYCQRLLEVNFRAPDIEQYTQTHFDVIPINAWGIDEVTDPRGDTLSERDFAVREQATFTPTLIFYDNDGNIALRLRGYYPLFQFRAALEYVVDGHYKREPFPAYLARGDESLAFEPGDLIEEEFFSPPPHYLDRSKVAAQRPLAVFFEQGNCHACSVLHGHPLTEPAIRQFFEELDVVQLHMYSPVPVVTPSGKATTAREWARDLGLFYAPSVIFFDENGGEILRVDSVAHFFRLRNVLNYVASRAYLYEPSFLRWRSRSAF